MSLAAKLRRAPLRLATGAFILNAGVGKLSLDEGTAGYLHGAGAGAYPYMELMGLVVLGWMWLKMVQVSGPLAANGSGDRDFHEAKLITARFYAERELPLAPALRRQVEAGAEAIMKLPEEAF